MSQAAQFATKKALIEDAMVSFASTTPLRFIEVTSAQNSTLRVVRPLCATPRHATLQQEAAAAAKVCSPTYVGLRSLIVQWVVMCVAGWGWRVANPVNPNTLCGSPKTICKQYAL